MITSKQLQGTLEKHIHDMKAVLDMYWAGADLKVVTTEALMYADNLQGFLTEYQAQEESSGPSV